MIDFKKYKYKYWQVHRIQAIALQVFGFQENGFRVFFVFRHGFFGVQLDYWCIIKLQKITINSSFTRRYKGDAVCLLHYIQLWPFLKISKFRKTKECLTGFSVQNSNLKELKSKIYSHIYTSNTKQHWSK